MMKFLDLSDLWRDDLAGWVTPIEHVVPKVGKEYWMVTHNFTVTYGDQRVTVPKGFRTDLASFPWGFRNLISKVGRHVLAAVVHDWLYNVVSGHADDDGCAFDRWVVDALFLAIMTALGVPTWRRQLMHKAVRLGGGLFWRKPVLE